MKKAQSISNSAVMLISWLGSTSNSFSAPTPPKLDHMHWRHFVVQLIEPVEVSRLPVPQSSNAPPDQWYKQQGLTLFIHPHQHRTNSRSLFNWLQYVNNRCDHYKRSGCEWTFSGSWNRIRTKDFPHRFQMVHAPPLLADWSMTSRQNVFEMPQAP